MPTPDQMIAWQREWTSAWENNDADMVAARFHPDCILNDYGVQEPIIGPDQARKHAQEYLDLISGMYLKELSITTSEDRAYQEWESGGSVEGPDGKVRDFVCRGITVVQWNEEGQRIAMWSYWDLLGYLKQLGLMTDGLKDALGH